MREDKPKKWPELPWDEAVDRIEAITFQVQLPDATGTCFVVSIGTDRESGDTYYLLATAWHVIESADKANHPITLVKPSGDTAFEASPERYRLWKLGSGIHDTGLLFIRTNEPFVQQSDLAPVMDWDTMMARGAEVGWVGFPGIIGSEFCFFKGVVSGYLSEPPTYLVDGVAINGVSGGPVFDNRVHIIGLVSSYIPNQVDKYTTLPGLVALVPINAIRYWVEYYMGARVI